MNHNLGHTRSVTAIASAGRCSAAAHSIKPANQPHPILVPIDFSVGSRRALELSVRIAERLKAELVLLHVMRAVVYPTYVGHMPSELMTMSGLTKQRLERWATEVIPADMLARTAVLARSVLSREVARTAHDLNADWVAGGSGDTVDMHFDRPE